MITPIMAQIKKFIDRVPFLLRPLLLSLLPMEFQEVMSLTDNQISALDDDLEALIDAIGARDEDTVGRLADKYHLEPDGKVAEIILRLMGERVKE